MKKFIFYSILFSFLSGFAYAEEKKSELILLKETLLDLKKNLKRLLLIPIQENFTQKI